MPNHAAGAVRHILVDAKILYHKPRRIARGGKTKKEKPEGFSSFVLKLFKTGKR